MSTSPPLSRSSSGILKHTPHWVWADAGRDHVAGVRQLREYRVSRGRLLLVPIALGAYSIWEPAACSALQRLRPGWPA